MITPDEIKRGLECCEKENCDECPYRTYARATECTEALWIDHMRYLKWLEARVPKWISVEDRLPEDQRSVLTVNGHGEIRIMGLWSKCGDEWTWVHNDRMMHYNDITHWMSLPGIPKEE